MRRLRRLLTRPIAERERKRIFAACAVALLLVAAVLVVTVHHPEERIDQRAPRSVVVPPPSPPARAQPVAPAPASVLHVGRRFLATYLPYLYGHARAREVRGASRSLRRRLAHDRPRVSPATRRRRPRIVNITARQLGRARWALTATIADGGVARYPVELVVEQRHGARPVVVTLAAE